MADVKEEFYRRNITKFFKDKSASILVCGAGTFDMQVFKAEGFTNVTISNLDTRMDANQYAPYKWAFEDAAALSFPDNSFDYVAIHAAIHHASSPHRVLTEMYRVAKKGVFAIESSDSFVMRIFERYGLTQVYEHAAVYYNDGKFGGVNNTDVPNFVYRWTEREIEKTINVYAPYARHDFTYVYEMTLPVTSQMEKNGMFKYIFLKIAQPFFWVLTRIFKRQQNLFGFYIAKPNLPQAMFPWLKLDASGNPKFDMEWGDKRYMKEKPEMKQR